MLSRTGFIPFFFFFIPTWVLRHREVNNKNKTNQNNNLTPSHVTSGVRGWGKGSAHQLGSHTPAPLLPWGRGDTENMTIPKCGGKKRDGIQKQA